MYNVQGINVDYGGEVTNEDILKDIIETDQTSQEKEEMVAGVNYYNCRNDILRRDFREYYVDSVKYVDYNKSNDHIVNALHKTLVDQKQGYIVGKPVVIKSEDEELRDKVVEVLGPNFQDTIQDWVKGAANKGREDIQPFVTEDGEFDYCIIPAEQTVYLTDTTYQKKVTQCIRYYMMEIVDGGEIKERKRIEVWDNEKVTRYQEVDTFTGKEYVFIQPGTFGINANPEYHWYSYNTNFTDKSQLYSFNDPTLVGAEGHGWGKVPMVSLWNNSEKRSDLVPIKKYVDAMDIVSSGFLNDLKDIQLAIWVLRGYQGEDLAEFMSNLQKYKAISLDNADSSSAEPKTLEIPKEARSAMLEWIEQKIYEVGQGVNTQKITGGSITNVVIKAMYEGLNIKSNNLIVKLKKAFSEFMYFVVEYINDRDGTSYNYKDVHIEFDKKMLFNEKESKETLKTGIEAVLLLKGVLTDETMLKVMTKNMDLGIEIDIEEEMKKLAQQMANEVNSLETPFEG